MKPKCPQKNCHSSHITKHGSYYRADDARTIQRYRCQSCLRCFSSASLSDTYRQRKRRINPMIFKLLCSGVSQRRCAHVLGVNRKTIVRRLLFWSARAKEQQQLLLKNLQGSVCFAQLDDLITIEHTKLKPLSVSVFINQDRLLLGTKVSRIAAFGHLAKLSRAKYGKRRSELKQGLEQLFTTVTPCFHPEVLIQSDEHKLYPSLIKKHLPHATHIQESSEPAAVTGQGELKKKKFDPLFSINHSLAMLRANINRLFRKTWCTTKLPQMLQHHLNLYMLYHNQHILRKLS